MMPIREQCAPNSEPNSQYTGQVWTNVSSCDQCQHHLPFNAKEPLINKSKPQCPFQEVKADFCCHTGRNYLIVVDCYSDWPTIIPMGNNITTSHMITALRTLFSQTAVPDVFWLDGGPQFTTRKFQSFAEEWDSHSTDLPCTTHKAMVRLNQQLSQ